MKTKEEIKKLKIEIYKAIKGSIGGDWGFFSEGFDFGYTQCQEDNMENKYTAKDMEDYAKFCINCHINKVPCIMADNWFEQIKKI